MPQGVVIDVQVGNLTLLLDCPGGVVGAGVTGT